MEMTPIIMITIRNFRRMEDNHSVSRVRWRFWAFSLELISFQMLALTCSFIELKAKLLSLSLSLFNVGDEMFVSSRLFKLEF